MKRQRGRSRRSGGNSNNNNPNRHFESNGPDVKIRGSAQQILDKYMQYARDAQTSGDRINAEAYYQYAEHYHRVLAKMQPKRPPREEGDQAKAEDGQPKAEAEVETPDAAAKTDAGEPAAEPAGDQAEPADAAAKPKRRRNYRKRDAEAEAAQDGDAPADDGVAKTLSRGRASEPAEAADAAPESGDAPVEAAE